MAESEGKNLIKRNYSQNKNNQRFYSHNRLYKNLGVRDLREILDKKRQQKNDDNQGTSVLHPPADPPYNYLKDPLRDGVDTNIQRGRGHYRGRGRGRKNYQKQLLDIENPTNIKIEFSTSTGEHSYTIDESVTLPTIKHVPDKKPYPYKGRSSGAVGRGRYQRSYNTRTIVRNRNSDNTSNNEKLFEHVDLNKLTEKEAAGKLWENYTEHNLERNNSSSDNDDDDAENENIGQKELDPNDESSEITNKNNDGIDTKLIEEKLQKVVTFKDDNL